MLQTSPELYDPKPSVFKSIRHRLVRGLFRLQLGALRVTPWAVAVAWGNLLGLAGYGLSARYRRVADRNLRLAYGEAMTAAERRRLTRCVFQNFARAMLVEFLKVPSLSPAEVRDLVEVETLAPLTDALARGRGVIVVSAHLGNWELLARRVALEGFPVRVVTRQSHDAEFNRMTDALRENAGYTVHARGSSPRALLKQLRAGGIVAILCDQKSDDVFVPFFGHTAGTVAGPAVLALKTGAVLLPLFYPRLPSGKFGAVFLPEVDATPTGDTDADIARIMGDITLAIEGVVRRFPDQWLWLHDRWRLPPDFIPSTTRETAAQTR